MLFGLYWATMCCFSLGTKAHHTHARDFDSNSLGSWWLSTRSNRGPRGHGLGPPPAHAAALTCVGRWLMPALAAAHSRLVQQQQQASVWPTGRAGHMAGYRRPPGGRRQATPRPQRQRTRRSRIARQGRAGAVPWLVPKDARELAYRGQRAIYQNATRGGHCAIKHFIVF